MAGHSKTFDYPCRTRGGGSQNAPAQGRFDDDHSLILILIVYYRRHNENITSYFNNGQNMYRDNELK